MPLDRLTNLHNLSIGDSRRLSSLDGVRSFKELRSLGLYALPRLSTLTPIESLAETLEDLDLEQCRRLSTLKPVGSLRKLRRLILADCGRVPSLMGRDHRDPMQRGAGEAGQELGGEPRVRVAAGADHQTKGISRRRVRLYSP